MFNQLLQGRTFREHRVRQNKGRKLTIAFRACLCFAAKFARSGVREIRRGGGCQKRALLLYGPFWALTIDGAPQEKTSTKTGAECPMPPWLSTRCPKHSDPYRGTQQGPCNRASRRPRSEPHWSVDLHHPKDTEFRSEDQSPAITTS